MKGFLISTESGWFIMILNGLDNDKGRYLLFGLIRLKMGGKKNSLRNRKKVFVPSGREKSSGSVY